MKPKKIIGLNLEKLFPARLFSNVAESHFLSLALSLYFSLFLAHLSQISVFSTTFYKAFCSRQKCSISLAEREQLRNQTFFSSIIFNGKKLA